MSRTGRKRCPRASLLALVFLAGCQAPQREAREQANQRWNLARAEVKAKLAADQLDAGNVPSAAAELAEARRLAPDEPQFMPLQARIWLADGQTARAAQLLERTHLEGQPQAEIEYLLGIARQAQQRWADALPAFHRAIALNEGEVAYVVAAAQVHLQLSQPQLALDLLERFAGRYGWTDGGQSTAAECYEQLGDWPAAASAWQRVGGAMDAGPELRQRLAVALYCAGRYAEASPIFAALLKDSAGEPREPLHLFLAECYLAGANYAAAREQVQAVLDRSADDVRAYRLLARIAGAAGDYEAAVRAVRKALRSNAGDVGTLELAAALGRRIGDEELLAQSTQRLLELDPANPVAKHLLAAVPR